MELQFLINSQKPWIDVYTHIWFVSQNIWKIGNSKYDNYKICRNITWVTFVTYIGTVSWQALTMGEWVGRGNAVLQKILGVTYFINMSMSLALVSWWLLSSDFFYMRKLMHKCLLVLYCVALKDNDNCSELHYLFCCIHVRSLMIVVCEGPMLFPSRVAVMDMFKIQCIVSGHLCTSTPLHTLWFQVYVIFNQVIVIVLR